MRAINHALTGATIGVVVGRPVVAIPLALVSHYICDIIPHYGTGLPEKVELKSKMFRVLLLADAALCFLLVLILAVYQPAFWLLAAICAFVAAAPDLLSINRYRSVTGGKEPKPNRYVQYAKAIQRFERPIGAVVEIVWFIGMLLILVPIIRGR